MKIHSLYNDLFEEYGKKHDHNKVKGQCGTTRSDWEISSSSKASGELYFENDLRR